jgi:hypothetical protein
MWWSSFQIKGWRFHLNASPSLESIRHSIDVRLLVQFQPAQPLTRFTPLTEDNSIVAIIWIFPDQ